MRDRCGERFGDYVLEEALGVGAMGGVYLAKHTETGARVAVKLLRGIDVVARLRFQREGEAQASVDRHPNVLRVHSAGVLDGQPFLIMDVAAGGSLQDRLARGPLPIREAVTIARDLARGLQHVHDHGVLHRDLKPENILFDDAGTPKLGDFGLARIAGAGSLTKTGSLLGTPAYMAPEQASSDPGDPEAPTDVYGLGAILYTMLTGGPPFKAGSTLATLNAVLNDSVVPPSKGRPGVDRALDRICADALEKRAADRTPTAAALVADLDGWLAGDPAGGSNLTHGAIATACLLLVALLVWGLAPPPSAPPLPSPVAALTTAVETTAVETPTDAALERPSGKLESKPVLVIRHADTEHTRAAFLSARRFVTLGHKGVLKRWRLADTGVPIAEGDVKLVGQRDVPPYGLFGTPTWVLATYVSAKTIWILPDGTQHSDPFMAESAAKSPDGSRVAAGRDDTVVLFDTATRERVTTFKTGGPDRTMVAIAFYDEGRRLAAIVNRHIEDEWDGDHLLLLDIQEKTSKVVRLPAAPGRCVSARPGFDTLVVGTSVGEILLFKTSGELAGTLARPSVTEFVGPRAHAGALRAAVYASNSRDLLYSVSRGDEVSKDEVSVWKDGEQTQRIARSINPNGLELSPDGRTLLIPTRSGRVEVWRTR